MTDDNVIALPQKEKRIWVCACGCEDFELYEDGTIVCPICRTVDVGAWRVPRETPDLPEPEFRRTSVNTGSPDLNRRRVLKHAEQPDIRMIAVVLENNMLSVWDNFPSQADIDAVKENFMQMFDILGPVNT